MCENRIVTGDVFDPLVCDLRARPGIPGTRWHRMCWRTDRQQVDHHQFAVVLPASVQKTRFRMPAHRKGFAAIQHPWPIHAFVYFRGKVFDLLVGRVLPRRQYAAQQQRSVDGRKLALVPALPGLHVNEMKEESILVRQLVGEKPQRPAHTFENLRSLPVAAPVADAQTGQAKSCCGDTGHHSRIVAIGKGTIFYLARVLARFIPEEIESSALNLIEKLLIGSLVGRAGGLYKRLCGPLSTASQCRKRRSEQT